MHAPIGRFEIGRAVDVPTQSCIPNHDDRKYEPLCLRPMTGTGTGAVLESESGAGGERKDVGAVVVTVGHQHDGVVSYPKGVSGGVIGAVLGGEISGFSDGRLVAGRQDVHHGIESESMGKVRVGDDHPGEAGLAEFGDSLGHSGVQSPAWFPDDSRPDADRPVGNLRIVTDDVHGSWKPCRHDCSGHRSGEFDPLGREQCSGETPFGHAEPLDRDEDCDSLTLTGHEAECRCEGR